MAHPSTWPKVGDPVLDFLLAPDCPAHDDPADTGLPFYCTRDAGHAPPHVAEGLTMIVHVWTDPTGGA